MAHAAEGLQ